MVRWTNTIFQFVTHCINVITGVGCAVHQEHFNSYLVALHVTQFLKISYITKQYWQMALIHFFVSSDEDVFIPGSFLIIYLHFSSRVTLWIPCPPQPGRVTHRKPRKWSLPWVVDVWPPRHWWYPALLWLVQDQTLANNWSNSSKWCVSTRNMSVARFGISSCTVQFNSWLPVSVYGLYLHCKLTGLASMHLSHF